MKQILLLFGWLAASIQSFPAATDPKDFRLSGIVNLPGMKLAIFSNQQRFYRKELLLEEGQSENGLEIHEIQPTAATVMAVIQSTNRTTFRITPPSGEAGATPAILFTNVTLTALLELYEMIGQRSLIRSPRLPTSTFSLQWDSTNRAEILAALEQKLSAYEIAVIPDGEKLALVLTKEETALFKPAAPLSTSANTNSNRIFPPGSLRFDNATLFQCVPICAELMGKPFDHDSLEKTTPRSEVRFHQITPLTRAEIIYVLETNLKLNGIQLVPDEKGTLKVVPFDAKLGKK